MSGHGYRYVGQGERYRGVPSRDLTQDEFEARNVVFQRDDRTNYIRKVLTKMVGA